MFKTALQAMEQRTAALLAEKPGASALWFNAFSQLSLKAYEPGTKVIYTSVYAFPMEILYAFDMVPFDFEWASGILNATDLGIPAMMAAEQKGYSPDICSMHRSALGAFYKDYFPRPDLLITTSFYCDGKAKTNEILANLFQQEAQLLVVPSVLNKESIRYVEKQLRQITHRISEAMGQPFDEDRLKEAIKNANSARKSHLKMLELLKHRPAPWGGHQLISYSIGGNILEGKEIKERINNQFIQEMTERIESGRLYPEDHRVFWLAWVPTYRNDVFSTLKKNAVSLPLCETARIYWDEIDEARPFEGLALKCLKNPFVGPISQRLLGLDRLLDDYSIDGALLFATPACRQANSTCRLIKDTLGAQGVPLLTLDMDICDARNYSSEQVKTRLEGFIELLN